MTYHDFRWQTGLGHVIAALLDELGLVVGTLLSTSQDNVDILVALSLNNCARTLHVNAEENMAGLCSAASVNCDSDGAVRGVLEANGH